MNLLKVDHEYLERNVNCEQKGFIWIRREWFLGRNRIEKVLIEDLQSKKHGVGFIGDWCSEIRKSVSDVGYNGYKRFSSVN